MGRGDKKTKKGKISMGSFGNSRKRRSARTGAKKTAAKKSEEPVSAEVSVKPKRAVKKKSEA